MISMNKNTLP